MARSAEFESGSRPLRWEDMSAQEQRVSQGLISQQSENIGARMTAKAATTKGSEKRKFENAAVHPDLVEQPQTLEQATDRLITGMHQAAQPEFTMPGEHLAGGEFYYQHGGAIRTAAKAADRIEDVAISSASRMSPRTTPTAERKTVVALGKAHGRGSVTFNDQVLNHLAQGYDDHDGRHHDVEVPPELHQQTVPFRDLPPDLVPSLRKGEFASTMTRNSRGVDWEGLRSVSLDRNLRIAHSVMQGNKADEADPYKNPKQEGYRGSIHEAVGGTAEGVIPEVVNNPAAEYRLRDEHIARTLRGDLSPGQQAFDVTGLQKDNSGGLSNTANIAADMYVRAKVNGQPPHLASQVSGIFLGNKTGNDPKTGEEVTVGSRDTRVTTQGIEHAFHQKAVENTAAHIERTLDLPFTVPSRMVQETAGWAVPRREAGKDPEFNAHLRETAPPRTPRSKKSDRLF
jgi:hypothetical protein